MLKRLLSLLLAAALLLSLVPAGADEGVDLDALMLEIDSEAGNDKALTVGAVDFEISADRQSIFMNRPEVTGPAEYTIAYNIYDSDSNPVNYFYSLEDRVAATPGYGGLFNVFVVVTDSATGESSTQNIGWQELNWPSADKLTVGRATYEISPDGQSVFVDRPDIRCRSGRVSIAYNIYDSNANPVNYFYSTQKRVAATPGYAGRFNVFIVVTDLETGEQDVQNIGWNDLGGGEPVVPQEDFEFTVSGNDVILVRYNGTDSEVAIPAAWQDRAVTVLGERCFEGKTSMTSVTLPDTLKEIRANAFSNCTGLTYVYIPNGVTTIGDGAFAYCSKIDHFRLPSTLTSIGDGAFTLCSSLSYISIPKKVTRIGNSVFFFCDKLTSVTIPDSVTSIGDDAFYDCTSLPSITIPGSVTSIGARAFGYCTSLVTVTVPGSVVSIGEGAFSGGHALETVFLPNPGTVIGEAAFVDCPYLTLYGRAGSTAEAHARENGIRFAAMEDQQETDVIAQGDCGPAARWTLNSAYRLSITGYGDMDDYRYEDDVPWYAYRGKVTSIAIADTITQIGGDAFKGMSNCTSLKMGNSVRRIGHYAFSGCRNLPEIPIPDGVTTIDDYAFENCDIVTSFSFPAGLTEIGYCAFYHCIGLKSFEIAYGNTKYAARDGVLFDFFGETLICYPASRAGSSYTVPDGVTEIGDSAFMECKNLTEVKLPKGLKVIEFNAFCWAEKVSGITIPASVESIDRTSFWGCVGMASIQVASGNASFTSDQGILFSKDKKTLLCCPGGWAGACTIPSGVTKIEDNAFVYCRKLTGVTIPEGVVSLGDDCFYGCESLNSVTLPASMNSIGDSALANCHALTTVVFLNRNTAIGSDAFNWSTSLTIRGYAGSTAEAYARENNIPFEAL